MSVAHPDCIRVAVPDGRAPPEFSTQASKAKKRLELWALLSTAGRTPNQPPSLRNNAPRLSFAGLKNPGSASAAPRAARGALRPTQYVPTLL